MISRWLPLALFIAVFAPGLLHAQQQPTSQPRSKDYFSDAAEPTNYDKMYEDVEILRRILDNKLRPYLNFPNEVYAFGEHFDPNGNDAIWIDLGAKTMTASNGAQYKILTAPLRFDPINQGTNAPLRFDPINQGTNANLLGSFVVNAQSPHRVFLPRIEGVYLKGQGVIYTATLPSLQLPTKTTKRSFNNWEVGLRLGNEWENVRRQVRNEKEEPKKPEETKPPELSDVLLMSLMENGEHFSQLHGNESLTVVITVRDKSPASSGPDLPPIKPPKTIELATKVRDLELLADLHLKQGQYKEALSVFTRILEMYPTAELHSKLAQCYLGLNQMEKARTELDRAIEFSKKSQDAKDKSKPVAALPVKLIISAPKNLLQEMKVGRISFEELRRKAHVETLKFDAPRH